MRLPYIFRGSVTGAVLLLGMSLRFASTPCLLGASLCCVTTTMGEEERGEPRRTYNLPRGDAASTLRQFATVSGRPVFFMMDKVQGEQTNAINGDFTPAEALNQMLAGTPLAVLQHEGDEEFVVGRRLQAVPHGEVGHDKPQPKPEPMNPSNPLGKLRAWLAHLALAATTAATAQQSQETPSTDDQDQVVVLSPFTVSATSDVGYGSTMNTSGRLAKVYQDVPQMANVVTSEFLHDMKRFDTFSALTFVPGVNVLSQTIQATKMRGLDNSSSFVDGFRAPGFGNGAVNDIAFTDRIEVVKGPAPGSFGRGVPAGFINYVTKDPTFRRTTDVELMIGTGNDDTITQRYMIDTNGLVTADGKTAYRVVAVSSQGADTPELSEYENNGVLLALKRNFTGRGGLSVKALASKDTLPGTITPLNVVDEDFRAAWYDHRHGSLGFPFVEVPLLDRNAWLAYDSTQTSSRTFSTTAVFDYKLSDNWSTRQAVKFLQSKSEGDLLFNGLYQAGADGTALTTLSTPLRQLQDNAYRSSAYQSDFVGQYRIPAIDCALELLAGGDYSRTKLRQATDNQFPAGQPLVSWNPNIPLPGWSVNPDDKYYQEVRDDWSFYGQLEAKVWRDRLRFTGSWRKNYTDLNSLNTVNGARVATKTHTPTLPAYSVLFKINDGLSVYALHSQYIEPPVTQFLYARVASSHPLSQLRGVFQPKTDLTEIGLKGNVLDGRLGFSVCAYELKQSGAAKATVLVIPGASTEGTDAVTFFMSSDDAAKGFEFECFAKITDKLTFMLNGTYIHSSRTRGALTPIGQASVITNKELGTNPNTLAGYATYSFTGERRRGFALTAGWKTIFSGWEIGTGIAPARYPRTNTLVDVGNT